MTVFINPGSGPVAGASYDYAQANIEVFAAEVGADSWEGRDDSEDQGRWAFELTRGDEIVEVDMPGLPLERVRYVGENGQNIWDFPRLYVDGSSWVWMFAVGVCWSDEDEVV